MVLFILRIIPEMIRPLQYSATVFTHEKPMATPTAFFGMLGFATFDATPDLTDTVKAERISFQWMETSANTTDSARQDQMIA